MHISELLAELGVVKNSIECLAAKAKEEEKRQRLNVLDDSYLQQYVNRYIENRQLRLKIIADDLFFDPNWDILVDLYFSRLVNRNVHVTSAILSSNIPQTTGLRVLDILIERGWIYREKDPFDGRKTLLHLSDGAHSLIHGYFVRVSQSGVSAALARRPELS